VTRHRFSPSPFDGQFLHNGSEDIVVVGNKGKWNMNKNGEKEENEQQMKSRMKKKKKKYTIFRV